ncbi:MAG: hypothetical protein IJ542_01680 [Clostridia bacterium]|nr:hypothetical protein [Clostridia bacterium]
MRTEIEKKIAIAKRQNKILTRIFDCISQDKFNTELPLDDIGIGALKDFWVYTSGVLGVQNFENASDELSVKEVRQILNGQFFLKRLTSEEAKLMRKEFKIPNSEGGRRKVELYNIQDGTFSLKHVVDPSNRQISIYLSLDCDGIEYVLGDKEVSIDGTDEEVLMLYKTIRNIIVHSTPYLSQDKTKVIFVGQKYVKEEDRYVPEFLTISKMWLRGFSELFADTHTKISAEQIEKLLTTYYFSADAIVDERGLERALFSIKDHLPPSICDNISREMVYLVKDNIVCYDKFYQKDSVSQTKIISNLLANHIALNLKYPKTINLPIIYKIQQLVAKKLNERGQREDIDIFDNEKTYGEEKLTARQVIEMAKSLIAQREHVLTYGGLDRIRRARILSEIGRLKEDIKNVEINEQKIKDMLKSETLHMNLFKPEGLENLPVEVGFNVVCLAAYNALVTSGFYEDILHNLDFNSMSKEYGDIFRRIHLNGLTYANRPYTNVRRAGINVGNTAYLLECMRNALVHGTVSYKVPAELYGANPTFKDAVITFKSNSAHVVINGNMEDMFKLFTSGGFFASRREIDPEIVEEIHHQKYSDEGQPGDE